MTIPPANSWLIALPIVLSFATAALASVLLFLRNRQESATTAATATAAASAVTAAASAAATAATTAAASAAALAVGNQNATAMDLMWDFVRRRAVSEFITLGMGVGSDVTAITEQTRAWYGTIEKDLKDFYFSTGQMSDRELFFAIERKFGDRILREVCIPNGLYAGSCILGAMVICREASTAAAAATAAAIHLPPGRGSASAGGPAELTADPGGSSALTESMFS